MSSRIRNLVQELRERSVFRTMVTYAFVSWMLLQVADVTFDRLPLPENAMTVLIVLVIIGFPLTLTVAWAYELTTRGLVPHAETDGGVKHIEFIPFLILVMVVTAGAGYGLYRLSRLYFETPAPSIAVLPFANLSPSPDDEYFSDGLTEEIQNLLVRVNEFRVVALNSAYQLKGTNLDMRQVAQRLAVNVLLHGSVRRAGSRLRITARLVDGEDGFEMWSDSYDRELTDIFAIQEDIARKVAAELDIALPEQSKTRVANLGTTTIESYDFYLRAIDNLRLPKDEATLAKAENYLLQAIAIDVNFAKAYAALCETYLIRYEWSRATSQFENAERACHRALTRESGITDVHLALGRLYLSSGQYERAISEFETALALTPNSADAFIGLGKAYVSTNRPGDAETSLRSAIEIDPSYWAGFNEMGNFLFSKGRFREAANYYNDFARRAQDNATAYNNLGAAYYLDGDFNAAAKAWESSLEIRPTRSAYSNTGSMYFYLGLFELAAERYANAIGLAPEDYRLWGNIADAYYFSSNMRQVADVAYRRAIEFAQQRLEVNSQDADTMSNVAYFNARLGNRADADDLQAQALALDPDNMYIHYNSALIHTQFDNFVEAIASLERALELNYQPDLVPADPGLSALRDHEKYQQLVAQHLQ